MWSDSPSPAEDRLDLGAVTKVGGFVEIPVRGRPARYLRPVTSANGKNPSDAAPDPRVRVPPQESATRPTRMLAPKGKDQHMPTAFVLAISSVVLFFLVALLGPHQESFPVYVRVALTAIAVAACSRYASLPAAVLIAGIGWLFMKGFLFPRPGVIEWHGKPDAVYLLVLVTAALVAVQVRMFLARRPEGEQGAGRRA
jgi:hypothetical protein